MQYPYGDKYEGIWEGDKRKRGTYTFAPAPTPLPAMPVRPFRPDLGPRSGGGAYGRRNTVNRWRHLFAVNHFGGRVCETCHKDIKGVQNWFRSNEKPYKDVCLRCFEEGRMPQMEFTDMGVILAQYPWGGVYVGSFHPDAEMHGEGTLTLTDGTVQKGYWHSNEFVGEITPDPDGKALIFAAPSPSPPLSPSPPSPPPPPPVPGRLALPPSPPSF
eukprot:Hpha_TRINITY_DN10871_c0_g1::TRINITY_DN10871_c0_g1_i1::g.23450::m.23450